MFYNLNDGSHGILRNIESLFRGWPSESENIKVCAFKYASCNHKYYFTYIVYRIQQATLSIFGFSDWQKAQNEAINLLKQKADSPIDCLKIKSQKEWDFLANKFLGIFVEQFNFISKSKDYPDFKNMIGNKASELTKGILADFSTEYHYDPFVEK